MSKQNQATKKSTEKNESIESSSSSSEQEDAAKVAVSTKTKVVEASSESEGSDDSSESSSDSESEKEATKETKKVTSAAKKTKKEESESSSSESSSDDEVDKDDNSSESSSEEEEKPSKKEAAKTNATAGRSIFMMNFSGELTEEEIKEEVSKIGEIEEIRVPRKRDQKRNRGFLHCCFKDSASVAEALKLNGQKFLGCTIKIEELKEGLKSKEEQREQQSASREERRADFADGRFVIFAGNLPYEVDERAFKKFIEGKSSDVKGIRLPMDKETGRKRGFAFLDFGSKDAMESFLKLDLVYDDRKLNLNESVKRQNDDRKGGDDRRGGDRRNNFRDNDRRDNFRRREDNGDDRRGGRSFEKKGDNRRNSKNEKENTKRIKYDESSE